MSDNQTGEQPLPRHGACGLCSINLSEYVINPFTENAIYDKESLEKDMYYIVKAMDDIVEENLPFHALDEQRDIAKRFRNLGIGVMGIHDLLIKLGLKYGSKESLEVLDTILKDVISKAIEASSILATERGKFPEYSEKMFDSDFYKNIKFSETETKLFKTRGLRNSTLLSIAPTGLMIGSV